MKILVICMYHPELVHGGSQLMAYELFQGLRAAADVEPFLLASADHNNPEFFKSGASITGFDGRPNEFLFLSQGYDYTWDKCPNANLAEAYSNFLQLLQPDVVHFHHFMTFGVDYFTLTRKVLPHAKLIFTMHEFLTICPANGHMRRRTDGSLCTQASPARCHQCVPGRPPEHYFAREMWMKAHLAVIDRFTAPSRFMIGHYAQWGLDAEKFTHVPNGLDIEAKPIPATNRRKHNRFGFFGQLVEAKGLHVLLQAVTLLRADGFTDFTIEINGDNINFAAPEWRAEVEAFLAAEEKLPVSRRNVVFNGAYHHGQLRARMARVDWVVVPSIWWEIFCLVISEAWAFGRPVIASNAGGPAERVTDGKDGLLFELGDARALADTIRRACAEDGLWQTLAAGITPPAGRAEMVRNYLSVYAETPAP